MYLPGAVVLQAKWDPKQRHEHLCNHLVQDRKRTHKKEERTKPKVPGKRLRQYLVPYLTVRQEMKVVDHLHHVLL
jgi:hypothetical protein